MPVRLFLCGDVMTGRGIDQVLAQPCDPTLHERYVASAEDYVGLAEQANGPIPRHAGPSYIWGAALDELDRMRPDARIINLETAITRGDDYVRKGINYRSSPENADCLSAAGIDCCVLANNHVLDWGRSGLLQTLATLERLKIKTAGAGRNAFEAAAPAALQLADNVRVLVFAFGTATSGVPRSWAATADAPGANLTRLSEADARRAADHILSIKQPGDLAVVSLHWGPNWGYDIPDEQRIFARSLIDSADVSIIHGHSSHHAKAIEVYHERLILYGCGDFLNDYGASAAMRSFAATWRRCISRISNRRPEISPRWRSSRFKSGTSGSTAPRGRTSNGCNRRSIGNLAGSGPASCSIHVAGSCFPVRRPTSHAADVSRAARRWRPFISLGSLKPLSLGPAVSLGGAAQGFGERAAGFSLRLARRG